MKKEEIYKELKSLIEEKVLINGYIHGEPLAKYNGCDIEERTEVFEDVLDKYDVSVEMTIEIRNKHNNGDYYNEPYDTGVITAYVDKVEVIGDNAKPIFEERVVKSLTTKIEY